MTRQYLSKEDLEKTLHGKFDILIFVCTINVIAIGINSINYLMKYDNKDKNNSNLSIEVVILCLVLLALSLILLAYSKFVDINKVRYTFLILTLAEISTFYINGNV